MPISALFLRDLPTRFADEVLERRVEIAGFATNDFVAAVTDAFYFPHLSHSSCSVSVMTLPVRLFSSESFPLQVQVSSTTESGTGRGGYVAYDVLLGCRVWITML